MRRLGLFTLFGLVAVLAALPAARGSRPGDARAADRDHAAELRRRLAQFQSLPPTRQEQIRELDRQLHELEPAVGERLTRVMENYAAWLDRLPEEDRKKVTSEPGAEGRLLAIRDIRQREWIRRLPLAYREQYRAARNIGERVALVEQWRLEEQERDEEWHVAALKHWNDVGQRRVPQPFSRDEFRQQIDRFVRNLDPALSDGERSRLTNARQLGESGNWIPFARLLVELSDRHPLLPAPVPGPKTYDSLPPAVKRALPDLARKLPKQLEAASGRWPDFAVAVVHHAKEERVKLPEQLGPTNRLALPPEARKAVDELEAVLRRPESAKELERLNQAIGHWPRYPQVVMELTRLHKIPVPGWTLPAPQGRPDFWNIFRFRRERPKQ